MSGRDPTIGPGTVVLGLALAYGKACARAERIGEGGSIDEYTSAIVAQEVVEGALRAAVVAWEGERAAHERELARAYWRGMLGPAIEKADFAVACFEAKKARENLGWDVAINWNKRRAARLRAIADGPMWEPWWERRKAGA